MSDKEREPDCRVPGCPFRYNVPFSGKYPCQQTWHGSVKAWHEHFNKCIIRADQIKHGIGR